MKVVTFVFFCTIICTGNYLFLESLDTVAQPATGFWLATINICLFYAGYFSGKSVASKVRRAVRKPNKVHPLAKHEV